jgi:hypothetical protein
MHSRTKAYGGRKEKQALCDIRRRRILVVMLYVGRAEAYGAERLLA